MDELTKAEWKLAGLCSLCGACVSTLDSNCIYVGKTQDDLVNTVNIPDHCLDKIQHLTDTPVWFRWFRWRLYYTRE